MKLDKYQQAVIDESPNSNLRVIGVPGAGKTRCMTSRYVSLYTDHGIKPSRILTLTFSKKSAKEMSQRIQKQIDTNRTARGNISTINAFCHRAYNDWLQTSGKQPLKVWEYGDNSVNPMFVAAELMQKHLKTSDLSIFDQINKTLSSHYEPDETMLYTLNACANNAKAGYTVWRGYQKYLKENNLVDFYGQLWNFDRLIHLKEIIGQMIAENFDKILVDEAQDMFPQTYRILLKLAQSSSIEFYGDPSQSIYGFNGAAPYLMAKLQDLIQDLKTYYLLNNYRSVNTIVEVINDFGPKTAITFQNMIPNNIAEGKVAVSEVETIPDQADYIAEQIEAEKFNPGDIAVLARTNSQCSLIYQRLIELGVPAYYESNFSIWDRKHIKAAMSYFSIVKGCDTPLDLANITNIPSEDFTAIFGQSKGKYIPTRFLPNSLTLNKMYNDFISNKHLLSRGHIYGTSDLEKFITRLRGQNDNSAFADITSAIVKHAQWSGKDYANVEDDLIMLNDKLANLDYSIPNLKAYIKKIQENKRKIKTSKGKVNVMTIHQAKGLEFLITFVTGLSEPIDGKYYDKTGFHPGRNTNPEINEENCLYYVAISRAIKYLYLLSYLRSGEVSYTISDFVSLLAKRKAGYTNGSI